MITDQKVVPKKIAYEQKAPTSLRRDWWALPDTDRGISLYTCATQIQDDHKWRLEQDKRNARLYSLEEMRSHELALRGYAAPLQRELGRIALNAIKACVDTACAKISKNKPRPLFLTEKGKYTERKRAEKLTQYIDGQFDDLKVYQKGQHAFFQACVYGTGALKAFRVGEHITVEPVLCSELFVDELEAIYGNPRTLYQVRFMHRADVMELFGDTEAKRTMISAVAPAEEIGPSNLYRADIIKVIEAWRLPSEEGKKDGVHAVAVEGGLLCSDKWEHDNFPFAFIRWSPRLLGFYGGGLPESIQGIQVEINRMCRDISEAHRLVVVPRIIAPESMNIRNVTNKIGSMLRYSGAGKLEFNTPQGFPPEIYEHLDRLWNKCFEASGVSQLSATSKKPAGLDSGVALREFNDIETERFVLTGQAYENMYLDLAKIIIQLSRETYGDQGKVRIKGGKWIKTVPWKDVDLEDDKFTMRAFPASLLSSQPSGRLQQVKELIESGMMDKEVGLKQLDFPDVEEFVSLQTAALEDTSRMLELMLDEGKPQVPDPLMDLNLCIKMSQSAALRAKMDGVPEENIDLVRTFIKTCLELLKSAQPPPPPAPMGPPPQIPAPGGALPPPI